MQACDVVGRLLDRSPTSAQGRQLVNRLDAMVAGYPRTPMVVLQVEIAGRARTIRLKLEGESPWGSIKGRTAIGLLCSVAHRIGERSHLVESTSGNLGVALAELARDTELRFTAVVDERLPNAHSRRLAQLSADLITADPEPGVSHLQRRLNTVARLVGTNPDWIWLNQYDNPANPRVHEVWTAPELHQQVPGMQAIFVAASTGGTLAGVAGYLRRAAPRTTIVGVDVQGSSVFGGAPGPRILTGIGASRQSRHLVPQSFDATEIVSCWEGIGCCRALAEAVGLRLGGSSGAVLTACLRYLWRRPEITDVVCVCPDLGTNYGDSIYDDGWIARERNRLVDPAPSARFARSGAGLVLRDWEVW